MSIDGDGDVAPASPIGWGFVGTGLVARQMAEAVALDPGSTLRGVTSRDAARGAVFAAEAGRAPGARVTSTVADLVADDSVEVVYVASPNALHEEQVLTAVAAGKHVLCEKPMAMSADECRGMIAAAADAGVVLRVGFHYRHHAAMSQMRRAIADDEIGTPTTAEAAGCLPVFHAPDWYLEPGMASGGVLLMSGIHRIDLLRYVLASEVVEVSALTASKGRPYETTVVAALRFGNGVHAMFRSSVGVPFGADVIGVDGSTGTIEVGGATTPWLNEGTLRLRSARATTTTVYAEENLHARQVAAMRLAIADPAAESPLATGTDGLRTVEVVRAIYASAAERSAVTVG
jgi:1,5-anhydro-D-fructose reductase (1,5-anhydro-D-mannitol-forming)